MASHMPLWREDVRPHVWGLGLIECCTVVLVKRMHTFICLHFCFVPITLLLLYVSINISLWNQMGA